MRAAGWNSSLTGRLFLAHVVLRDAVTRRPQGQQRDDESAAAITVFTTAVCTHCARAKAALTAAAVAYVEIDVGEDVELLTRLKASTGRGTVPQVGAKLLATAELMGARRCGRKGAEKKALWGQDRLGSSVLEAGARASGSPFTAGKRWPLGVGEGRLFCESTRSFAR